MLNPLRLIFQILPLNILLLLKCFWQAHTDPRAFAAVSPGILFLWWVREVKQETSTKLPDKSSRKLACNFFHFTSSNAYQKFFQQNVATNPHLNPKLEMWQRNQTCFPYGNTQVLGTRMPPLKPDYYERESAIRPHIFQSNWRVSNWLAITWVP